VQLHVGLMKINDGIKDLKILILGLTLQNLLQKISFLLKILLHKINLKAYICYLILI
jgi:hypothetical protein